MTNTDVLTRIKDALLTQYDLAFADYMCKRKKKDRERAKELMYRIRTVFIRAGATEILTDHINRILHSDKKPDPVLH